MATKKPGIIEKAMDSKPVVATKDVISKAVTAAVDFVKDPPLAPDMPAKPMRRAASKKTAAKKKPAAKMDRKLVSTMEDYEVKYLAQKWKVTQKAVKAAVAKVGHSRNKVESELKRGQVAKTLGDRVRNG